MRRVPGDCGRTAWPLGRRGRVAGNANGGVVGGVIGGLSQAAAPIAGKPSVAGQAVSPPESAAGLRAPMVIRIATLRIVVRDFANVRTAVEAIVSQSGGSID